MFKSLINPEFRSRLVFIASSFLNVGFSFIMTPLYTNILELSDYGVLSVYQVWVSVFSVLIGLSVHSSIANFVTDYAQEQLRLRVESIAKFLLYIGVLSVCLAYLGRPFLGVISFGIEGSFLWVVLINAFGSACFGFLSFFFIYTRSASKYFYLVLVYTLAVHSLSYIIISRLEDDKYWGKIWGFGIMNLPVLIMFVIMFVGRPFSVDWNHIREALKISFPIVFHLLSNQILGYIDRLYLSESLGSTSVAIYSVSYTVASTILILSEAISTVWSPWYFKALSVENHSINNYARRYMFVIFALASVLIVLGDEIILLISNEEYIKNGGILPILVFGIYCLFLYRFSLGYLHFKRKTVYIPILTMVSASINIVLNIILVPNYGMIGAALATLLSYFALLVLVEYVARRIFGFSACSMKNEFLFIILLIFCLLVESLTVVSLGGKIVYTIMVFVVYLFYYERNYFSKLFRF